MLVRPDSKMPLPSPPRVKGNWALFLDVDGTLLEFAATPNSVHIPDFLPQLLADLSDALGGALALVSGRPLVQLEGMFGATGCLLVGLHGLECRLWANTPPLSADISTILEPAYEIAQRFPGAMVENKGSAVAFHWRGNPEAEGDLVAFAKKELELRPEHVIQHGAMVVEIRPKGSKGDAIAQLLTLPPFRNRVPVFVGDDFTDESGFQEAVRRGGLGVLVGERIPTAAQAALGNVAAVHSWLLKARPGRSADTFGRRIQPSCE